MLLKLIQRVLCFFGIHSFDEHGFLRECRWCGREEILCDHQWQKRIVNTWRIP